MDTIEFFKNSIKNIKTVGTLTRSSKYVCKEMVSHVDFEKSKVLVELGAGDGVITKHILNGMRPDCKLLSFEVNSAFCEVLKEIKDDRLILVEDSAERLPEYLAKHKLEKADFIISAIPFVALPEKLSTTIVNIAKDNLKTGGKYIQIHYSLLLKKLYKSIFGNVDINFVPINMPPAFILVSEKK